jgi:simple sugar transport system ATP-binding protein
MKPILEVRNVTKTFGSVVANEEISLSVQPGEIVALLGENGAGKSTLVKAVFGILKPDSGKILIDGEEIAFGDTAGVIARGVGMVHQHFQLVPVMSVTENIFLGDEPRKGFVIDRKGAREEVVRLAKKYGLEVDPDSPVEDLPVGTQQRVEILKALRKNVRLLILDEPSAVLTPQETDELLQVIKGLAAQGVGIILITHKLREVMAVADRVVVLRGGKMVGTTTPKETDEAGLAQLMVGRTVILDVNKSPANPGEAALTVKGLSVKDDRGLTTVKDVSFEVRAGEILGIAGVEGNGQRELVEAICGMRNRIAGEVLVHGKPTKNLSPDSVHAAGVAHVPEDREKHGLVASYSIADNLILNRFDESPFASSFVRHLDAVDRNAEELVKKFDVRTPSAQNPASSLSGGNKQKVIVARELSQGLKVIVAAQPTRGVDVGSIEFIHQQLVNARDHGAAVLLVSAELDEILSLADRVAVISGGSIVSTVDAADADRNLIGRLMAGLKE